MNKSFVLGAGVNGLCNSMYSFCINNTPKVAQTIFPSAAFFYILNLGCDYANNEMNDTVTSFLVLYGF
jgi:hypothetical protein